MKWSEGWVSPLSSLEIEEALQRQASARATCERPCPKRSFFNASPNAVSVFNPSILAGIDQLVYRNVFLLIAFMVLSEESLNISFDEPHPFSYPQK